MKLIDNVVRNGTNFSTTRQLQIMKLLDIVILFLPVALLNLPAGQLRHWTIPALSVYVPALQAMQDDSSYCPSKLLYVPASHGV